MFGELALDTFRSGKDLVNVIGDGCEVHLW